MSVICKVFLVSSVFALVSSAPHAHVHKSVYVGGEGGGHADGGGSGSLSVSASLGGDGGIHKEYEAGAVQPAPEVKAHKTVIERTVIPQYVEKTIQVPSYVEKTIRVPTYVEKKVKVPVQPAIVEKTISEEHVPVKDVKVKGEAVNTVALHSGVGSGHSGQGGFYVSGGGHGGYGHGSGLFDSIFNIPIQTLGAVNGLLNGLVGGRGHVSAGFSKHYSAY